MTFLNLQKDLQGFSTEGRDFSNTLYNAIIPANDSATLTVPSSYKNWLAIITGDYFSSFWISINGTAAIPVGGTFAQADSEFANLYKGYDVKLRAGDIISILNSTSVSPSDLYVSIALYVVQNGA